MKKKFDFFSYPNGFSGKERSQNLKFCKMLGHHISKEQVIIMLEQIFALREDGLYSLIIGFLPTIIAISYPLIAQTISKVNETYNSSQIVEYFNKNHIYKNFRIVLIISLILSGLTFFNHYIIDVLAFISCVILIIYFIKLIDLVLTIYNPKELFDHINKESKIDLLDRNFIIGNLIESQKHYHKIIEEYFEIITELYCYSIRIENFTLQSNIKDKFFLKVSSVGKYIKSKTNEQIDFEAIIFNNNFKIIETFVIDIKLETRYKPIDFFSSTYYFDYSIDETGPTPLSNETLRAIWRYIILLIKTKKFNVLNKLWEINFSYLNLYLNRSYLKYDENSKITKESERKNNLIIDFRNRLNEFNISFLALLYYKKKYKLIDKLLFQTDSQPPKLFLSKFSFDQILKWNLDFRKDSFERNWNVSYYFDDLEFDSIGFQKDSKYYISEFCLILLLFKWIDDYGLHLRVDNPTLSIPDNLNLKKSLIYKLPFLIRQLKKILDNKNLITKTNLQKITRRNCFLSGIKYPIDFLEEYRMNLENQFEIQLGTGPLDNSKIKELKEYTVNQIKSVYDNLSRIKGNDVTKEKRDSISDFMEVIRGTRIPLNREAFLENSTVHYIDYDKTLGRYIKNEYNDHFLSKISLLSSKTYMVEYKELFNAVDLLQINKESHLIIAVNLNLDYLNSFLKLELSECQEGLEDYRYKDIPIFSYSGGRSRTGQLYVFNKENKPMIKHKDWKEINGPTQEFISRWKKMELIDEDLKIYYQHTEIKDDKELLKEYLESSQFNKEELLKMVQFDVDFMGYCWFPKDIKIVNISQGDMFKQGGNLNKLEEIEPFDKN
ncbi:hypothetical protein [Aquiflexum gelatinilyticum]|uniref:Uncharacterized protein n=1 Tax=Aquiflexum gelatinilyticum TaxID=2961943 RepID=A0A9X2SXI5_9BACT|nr:hypothetical protein [Aquiflexum gelatinilyticum]MCR9013907.1 hypothetical protein [Aquiflexum gelatinilyticum]